MYITKTLAKAKMDESIVKLSFPHGFNHSCRVMKLLGTKVEVYSLEQGTFTVNVNDLVGVDIIKEKQDA